MLNDRIFIEFTNGIAKMLHVVENANMIKICTDSFLHKMQRNYEITIHYDKIHWKDVMKEGVNYRGDPIEKYTGPIPYGYGRFKGTLKITDILQTGIKLLPDGERKPGHVLSITKNSNQKFGLAIVFSTVEANDSEFRSHVRKPFKVEDMVVLKSPKGWLALLAYTDTRAF